jgi:hypothetical protein
VSWRLTQGAEIELRKQNLIVEPVQKPKPRPRQAEQRK